jgi:hypothetical protein
LAECTQKRQPQHCGQRADGVLAVLLADCIRSLSAILAFLKKQDFLLSYRAHPSDS